MGAMRPVGRMGQRLDRAGLRVVADMTANNNWPGKPGVPMHPERDGWHWLETPDGERVPYEWRSAGECERGRWPSYWVSRGEDCWEAPTCKYLAPVLTPDEAAALQKRCEEAERERDALRRDASQEIATDELVRRLQHLGDWQAADRIEALQKRVAEVEGAIRTAAECIDADDTIAARGFLSDVLIKKYKPKWVCPNNTPGCLKNCGNYGCGN